MAGRSMDGFGFIDDDTMTYESAWAGHEPGTATLPPGVVSSEDPNYWMVGGPPERGGVEPVRSVVPLEERIYSGGHRIDHLDLDENGFVKDGTFDAGFSGQHYVNKKLEARGFKGACCGGCAGGGECEGCGSSCNADGPHGPTGPETEGASGPITPWREDGDGRVKDILCCDGKEVTYSPHAESCPCPDKQTPQQPPGSKVCCPCWDGSEMKPEPPHCPPTKTKDKDKEKDRRSWASLFDLPREFTVNLPLRVGCTARQQRGKPVGNGCGAKGMIDIVPDSWYPFTPKLWSMEKPCDRHDKCYGTCNNSKVECDAIWFKDMLSQCTSVPGWFWQIVCVAQAFTYYGIVDAVGCNAFKAAQKEFCTDPPNACPYVGCRDKKRKLKRPVDYCSDECEKRFGGRVVWSKGLGTRLQIEDPRYAPCIQRCADYHWPAI